MLVTMLHAQETTTLKLQMHNLKNEIVSNNIPLKVDDKNPVNKFGNNILEFKIPAHKTEVKLIIENSDYKIFYPLNNKLLVPKDVSGVIEIIVSTDKDYSTLISIYPLIKKLQAENTQSDQYCKTATKLIEEIKSLKADSVLRRVKQDSVFNILSPTLYNYVNAAFDLKKFLNGFDTLYFQNMKATNLLDSQIVNYSNAWKNIYFRKDEFAKAIEFYWDDNVVAKSKLGNVMRDIERIHKIYFYAQLNDLFEYFNKIPTTTNDKVAQDKMYKTSLINFKNYSNNTTLTEELNLLEKHINELKF